MDRGTIDISMIDVVQAVGKGSVESITDSHHSWKFTILVMVYVKNAFNIAMWYDILSIHHALFKGHYCMTQWNYNTEID